MNRNIFLRMQVAKPTVIEPVTEPTRPETILPSANQKFNPDVMIEYDKMKNNKEEYTFTKETWKGITGTEMNFNPEISSNFICASDTRDYEAIKLETETEISLRERERIENEEQIRLLNDQALASVLEFELTICGNTVDDTVIFDNLKINSMASKELTKEEKDYNDLVSSISTL